MLIIGLDYHQGFSKLPVIRSERQAHDGIEVPPCLSNAKDMAQRASHLTKVASAVSPKPSLRALLPQFEA
jgi:hypothetical protein